MNNLITLFDSDLHFVDQDTINNIVKMYNIDIRNLYKITKKYRSTNSIYDTDANLNEAVVLDYYELESFGDRKVFLKYNEVKLNKIGPWYISVSSIEIRRHSEKYLPFMDDTSSSDFILYISDDDEDIILREMTERVLELDFDTEKKRYFKKYSTMQIQDVYQDSWYNYYDNPRINDTKAKASYAAGYEMVCSKSLDHFPLREKDFEKYGNIY